MPLLLGELLEATELVAQYTAGLTFDDFAASTEKQDAVVRRLAVIGEAVKGLPEEFRTRYPEVTWRSIATDWQDSRTHRQRPEATDALARVQVFALRLLADHLEHGEAIPDFLQVAFQPATQSMEIADRDMIISKSLEPPSRKDFAALVSEARLVAKQTGMTPVDVDAAVKEVRRAR